MIKVSFLRETVKTCREDEFYVCTFWRDKRHASVAFVPLNALLCESQTQSGRSREEKSLHIFLESNTSHAAYNWPRFHDLGPPFVAQKLLNSVL